MKHLPVPCRPQSQRQHHQQRRQYRRSHPSKSTIWVPHLRGGCIAAKVGSLPAHPQHRREDRHSQQSLVRPQQHHCHQREPDQRSPPHPPCAASPRRHPSLQRKEGQRHAKQAAAFRNCHRGIIRRKRTQHG